MRLIADCLITSFPSTLGQAGCSDGRKKLTTQPRASHAIRSSVAGVADPGPVSHGFTHSSEPDYRSSLTGCSSHRFSERSVVSVICEDLRKSVDNPSGRDGLGCPISLRRSRFRLQRFRFTIPRRRIGDQRFKKMMRGMGHVIDRAIECFFVCARWLCKSGKLPNKLERRSANLVIRRWWRKIMQGLDGSTHV